jgi:hypothetical protein
VAHCPFDKLNDIAKALEEIRGWPEVREPKPGIFYFKSKPFLHFHEKDGKRWADIRDGADWGEPFPLPFKANGRQNAELVRHARKRYARQLTPRPE